MEARRLNWGLLMILLPCAVRVIPLGWGFIRGYAAPRYEKAVNGTGWNTGTGKKSVEAVARLSIFVLGFYSGGGALPDGINT